MLNVHPIPAFTDNYIWAIVYGKSCIVVDPGDSDPVFSFLKKNDLELNCILITHHHFDHTGGLINLAKHYHCPVYGPKGGHINGITIDLAENDEINVLNLNFKIFETPGHTLDHIAYFHSSSEGSLLFCGDTLFSGGCGRVFEGTFDQMFIALKKISKYPKETKIFCGHEYTLSNFKFALAVDENNEDLIKEYDNIKNIVDSGNPSLPTILEKELKINPFLRCDNHHIKNKIVSKFNTSDDELEVFCALRQWKDNF